MRRKVLAFIVSICMAAALLTGIPAEAQAAGESGVVRVKLSIGTVTSFSFFTDGNYSVGGTSLERQLYTVKIEGGTLNLYYGSKVISSGASIYVTQHSATSGYNNSIWLKNSLYGYRGYLGDMSFSISGSNLLLINYIDIEQYLYGVVPYEMSDSWPIEALKAQAVAARNYTAKRLGGGGSYDITDTSSADQVYKGYSPTATNARAAVDATAGQVLMSGSSIIDAYYSASNGGWTDLPYHRWGGGATWPYYTIAEDPYDKANPSSPFEKIYLPAVNLETALGVYTATTADNYSGTEPNAATAIGYIKQCIVNSGKLAGYGVTDVNGFLLTGVTNFYTTPPYDTDSGQDHGLVPGNGVNDGDDCVDKSGSLGSFTVSVGGTSYSVSDVSIDLRYLDGSNYDDVTTYISFFAPLGIFLIEPVVTDSVVTGFNLIQARYGHGCGLSQRGAQHRANNGQTYDQILLFYYPNTTRTTLSLTHPTLSVKAAADYSTATITNIDTLNVRSSPSSSSDANVLGCLPVGARIEVTDDFYSDSWHQINYGGAAAYVHKDYVTFDSPQVPKRVSGVSLSSATAAMIPGDSITLTATVSPATAVNQSVTWTSDSGAATVSNGVVTAVSEGTATIKATTAEGGYQAVCTVTVKSNGITSVKYNIGTTTVAGVLKNTDVALFISGLSNEAAGLHVYRADASELTSGIVGTGMTVALMKDGAEVDRLTIIVKGDANGDGGISISDYTLARLDILGLKVLGGVSRTAADINGDGSISISDYTLMRLDILGLKSIT